MSSIPSKSAVGAIAMVGSGEYLPIMQELEGALLQQGLARGKKNIYLQIPTAAGQESANRLAFWEEIGRAQADRLGAEPVFLPVFNRDDALNLEYAAQIAGAGLIYLSGGDPGHLSATLIGTPVWEAIVRNWQEGGSLAGCSAGAMAMASDVPNFRKMKAEGAPGLSLIPHIRVIPHYNKFFGWIPDAAAKILLKAPDGVVLLGIDEGTALVTGLDEGATYESRIWAVHGVAGVHILQGAPAHRYEAGARITL